MVKERLFFGRPHCRRGAGELESALDALAAGLNLRLTFYDLSGAFLDGDGGILPGQWRTHEFFPVCAEACAKDKKYCIQHCYVKANALGDAGGRPAFHKCRFGLVEAVVPIFEQDRHIASIFVGAWRRSAANDAVVAALQMTRWMASFLFEQVRPSPSWRNLTM